MANEFIRIHEYTINPAFIMVWYPVETHAVRIFFSGGREMTVDCKSADEMNAILTQLESACKVVA